MNRISCIKLFVYSNIHMYILICDTTYVKNISKSGIKTTKLTIYFMICVLICKKAALVRSPYSVTKIALRAESLSDYTMRSRSMFVEPNHLIREPLRSH